VDSYGLYFRGAVDNAIVYNRSLSASEVRENYLRGAGLRDYSGVGNNGTSGGWEWAKNVSGKFGYGLSFDGDNDYVQIPHSAALNNENWTIEAWIYLYADVGATQRRIFEKQQDGAHTYLLALFGNGYSCSLTNCLVATPSDGSTWYNVVAENTDILPGKWYHVAGTHSGTTTKIYINGVLEKTQATNYQTTSNTANAFIGSYAGSDFFFNGTIDNVIVYNRALSDEEVAEHYKAGILNLTVQARFGNTSSPDGSWTAWATQENQSSSPLNVVARYMQWRALLSTENASYSPVLNDASVSFASVLNPFVVENVGTVPLNVTLYATDLFSSEPNPSQSYLFKVSDYETGSIGVGSATSWTQVASQSSPVLAIANLNYSDSSNEARVDVKITVPSDEPPGARNSTIVFSASQA